MGDVWYAPLRVPSDDPTIPPPIPPQDIAATSVEPAKLPSGGAALPAPGSSVFGSVGEHNLADAAALLKPAE